MSSQESGVEASNVVVLKFGSSVLSSESEMHVAVGEIYREIRRGKRVVAVVSAIGKTTDSLIAKARAVSPEPCTRSLASYLATGEQASASLLGIALDSAGLESRVLDVRELGLEGEGDRLDAVPASLDRANLDAALKEVPVVVVPGFAMLDPSGGFMLLGRGGSDLTALFIAKELRAEAKLVKDVDGVFEFDPSKKDEQGREARRYKSLSFEDALGVGGRVVQAKAIELARSWDLSFSVARAHSAGGTLIGVVETELEEHKSPESSPMRVALLGAGSVGGGVYARLAEQPERFEVVGVLVRDVEKHKGGSIPDELLSDDADALLGLENLDLVIELIGGNDKAVELMKASLSRGLDVVTANKTAVASRGDELIDAAGKSGAALRFSASVGGVLPGIESVERISLGTGDRALHSLRGVLNGTCNFVLDRIAEGAGYAQAVKEAQDAGFAEADPTMDVDGSDAAQKLSILIGAGFGERVDWAEIDRRGIDVIDVDEVRRVAKEGGAVRLVASAVRTLEGVACRVEPVAIPGTDPLSQVRREWNVLVMRLEDGSEEQVVGKGAGRWPTTEAVMADVRDAERARHRKRLRAKA